MYTINVYKSGKPYKDITIMASNFMEASIHASDLVRKMDDSLYLSYYIKQAD